MHKIYIFFKIFLSGFLALLILTPLVKFYRYLPPTISDSDGATDIHYSVEAPYSYAYEGFSYGKFNNEGYNNLFDYSKGMSLDILVMGPSHMEAFQVMPEMNTANLLTAFSHKKVYNIGISAHYLPTCAQNLEAAVEKYSPKYVIIGIDRIKFADAELTGVLTHTLPRASVTDSSQGTIRSSFYRKYLREYVHKYLFSAFFIKGNISKSIENYFSKRTETLDNAPINATLLSKVLEQMSETASTTGTKLIIAYHPPISLNKDGSVKLADNPEVVKTFSNLCTEHGIYFVNTGERFLSEYEKNYTLPYGFFNTSVATGHLNKDGHRMFAEEIYKLIQQIEGKS